MFDVEIVGGKIVTPNGSFNACISIQDGKIAAISEQQLGGAKRTIDGTGLVALPGMIDQHVHFMDPGESDREDFIHGTSAAAVGGVTTVIEHTHSHPVRTVEDFLGKRKHIENRSLIDFGFAAHLWPGYFHELKPLWQAGISYFKAFTCNTHGIPGLSNSELYSSFSTVASFGGTILAHCEDDAVTAENEKRLKEDNRVDDKVVQEWRSKEAEEIAAANVAFIAGMTSAQVTIAHVSHPKIISIVQSARANGANLHAEICPQYMYLDENKLLNRGSFGKFTPPARSEGESHSLMQLLSDGLIQILSTDHAPSTKAHKTDGDIWCTHFGLPGIETTLPLMLNAVNNGHLTLERLVEVYSAGPARLLGLHPRKGEICVGADADIVLVDMNRKWTIKDEDIVSKAGWTPYNGVECTGKPTMTMVRGKVVMEDGAIVAEPGFGQYVHGTR